MNTLPDYYDVIIVGAGLVGTSLAVALSKKNLKIALIDAVATTPQEQKLLAVNYGSYCFLNHIQVWPLISNYSAPIDAVHVSQAGKFGSIYFHKNDINLAALGYVVPARYINSALEQLLVKTKCHVIRPATVIDIEQQDLVKLKIQQQNKLSTVNAQIVIAADGSNSSIRNLLNIDTTEIDYNQSALVTTVIFKQPHTCTAYERFIHDNGAIAMLPLASPQQCAMIWTSTTEHIHSLKNLTTQQLLEEIQGKFGYRLGTMEDLTTCHSYPLKFIHVKQTTQKNIILLGNAAHTIHPLAAQGLNLSWETIKQLSQQIQLNLDQEKPFNSNLEIKIDKTNLYIAHYLQKIFSMSNPIIKNCRQLGIIGIDLFPNIKNYFAHKLSMANIQHH